MTLLFFDIGSSELLLILIVIVIFFGANKIPELARGLGKGIRQFKDATGSIQREIEKSIEEQPKEVRKSEGEKVKAVETPIVKAPENSVAQKTADGNPFPEDKEAPKDK